MSKDSRIWSVEVVIGTNRWFLRDGFIVWISMLACFVGLILTTQAFFGSFPKWAQAVAALYLGLRAGVVVALIWAFVVFVVLRNRLLMRYRMGPEGIRCDTIRIRRRDGKTEEVRSVSRLVNWTDVSSAVSFERGMTVILKRGPWTVIRIFCPDMDTFSLVSREAEDRLRSEP